MSGWYGPPTTAQPWATRPASPNADRAYRASGLVPASYESAGRTRRGQGISREGNAELHSAIIELGRGLAQRDPDFGRYRASVSTRMKPLMAAIAVGHRAYRLAFALMRSGEPYDHARLAESVATKGERRPKEAGRSVKKTAAKRPAGTT